MKEIGNEVKSILLIGVGGQGTILASKILSEGLLSVGYDVKMSEIHGMSQRGGSVSTQIRYGKKVDAPIIGKGDADFVVAFEKMEALRALDYLKLGGKIIINDMEIPSVPILMGAKEYPEGIIEELSTKVDVTVFKAGEIAEELGNAKAMNVVLLGALTKVLNLDEVDWQQIITDNVKPKFLKLNLSAYVKGQEYVSR